MKGEENYERITAKEKERTAGKDIDMLYCPAYHTAAAGNRNNRYISGARRVENLSDLNGSSIGAVQYSELAALSEDTWPDSTIVYAEDFSELLKCSRQEAYERSMALLGTVGLMAKAYNYPSELSGGQQQRVAIARAIAVDPEIMLFDEPTSALGPTMVGEVLTVIRNLAQNVMTMLIVTHEMKFARDVSNRVFYMDEGVIYEEGEPGKIFTSPEKDKTRQFINHLRIFTYKLKDNESDALSLIHEVDSFSHRYILSQKLNMKLLTIAEELCMNSAFVDSGEDNEVDICFEYSSENNTVHLTVDYGGALRDPLNSDETIAVKLLKNAVPDLAYSSADGRNHIEGSITQ